MERLIGSLKEVFEQLQEDCKSFDEGNTKKAKDIAGRIRLLVKDGPRKDTISLLTHLNKKNIPFKDSADEYRAGPTFSNFDIYIPFSNLTISISSVYMGLVFKKVLAVDKYYFYPFCLRAGQKQLKDKSFEDWWEQIIYEDKESGYKLTRKLLILYNTEKDGVAHIDEKLPQEYKQFIESDSLNLRINGQKVVFENSPAKNSIRQIGYEVMKTLKSSLTDLLD
ncbi:MAG: hypothetical protein ACOYMB_02575 [Patescibacteria group bacterium]